MGEVIYTSSLLKTFLLTGVVVLVFLLFGVLGVWNGIRRRHENIVLRFARGCAGVFLAVVGLGLGAFIVFTALTGADTIIVHLNDKRIATDNCNEGTCQRYVLETQSGSNLYDIQVDEPAYQKAQIDSCYRVTYYSGRILFGDSVGSDSYTSITNATKIETVSCSVSG